MRIDVLVTGRTEAIGIVPALTRLFPGHDFGVVLERPRDGVPYAGFTSTPLPPPASQAVSTADRLATAAIAHLVPGRRRDPPDFLVVLDDLELDHVGRAQLVVDTFAHATRTHLASLSGRLADRCAVAVRERMSLHLVQPMIEAWFFADPAALVAAGAPAGASVVDPARDPEDFATTDAAYLAATEAICPTWVARGRRRKLRPKWLGNVPRERHPKAYLQWLCRDGSHKTCTQYDETDSGGPALAGIDWGALAGRPDGQVQFFRSLVADLADALNQEPSTGVVVEAEAPETSRSHLPRYPVLRNM